MLPGRPWLSAPIARLCLRQCPPLRPVGAAAVVRQRATNARMRYANQATLRAPFGPSSLPPLLLLLPMATQRFAPPPPPSRPLHSCSRSHAQLKRRRRRRRLRSRRRDTTASVREPAATGGWPGWPALVATTTPELPFPFPPPLLLPQGLTHASARSFKPALLAWRHSCGRQLLHGRIPWAPLATIFGRFGCVWVVARARAHDTRLQWRRRKPNACC